MEHQMKIDDIVKALRGADADDLADRLQTVHGMAKAPEKHSSAVVMLPLPTRVRGHFERCGLLSMPGAIHKDELHVTLAYLGKANLLTTDARKKILRAVRRVAAEHPVMDARLCGFGRFLHTDDDGDPLWAAVDCRGLVELRVDLMRELEDIIPDGSVYGWTPHITLAYLDRHLDLTPRMPSANKMPSWTWESMLVSFGEDEKHDVMLSVEE